MNKCSGKTESHDAGWEEWFKQIGNNIYCHQSDPRLPDGIDIGFGIQYMKRDRHEIHRELKGKYGSIALLRQSHSDRIVEPVFAESSNPFEIFNGDALITDRKKIALTVHTADCLPVLFYQDRKAIGAVHAGWRGTLREILPRTINKAVELYNLSLKRIRFIFMPAIRNCCYEVGPEVAVLFDSGRYNGKDLLTIDIIQENKYQLTKLGISEKQMMFIGNCTMCSTDFDYPSFRRDGRIKRRIINFIARRN